MASSESYCPSWLNGMGLPTTMRCVRRPSRPTSRGRNATRALRLIREMPWNNRLLRPREIYGHHRRFRHADNGGDIRVPGVVRHPFVGQGKTGDRAGGENAQNPALPQPGNHLAHAGKVFAPGVLILIHVHLDEPGIQLPAQESCSLTRMRTSSLTRVSSSPNIMPSDKPCG